MTDLHPAEMARRRSTLELIASMLADLTRLGFLSYEDGTRIVEDIGRSVRREPVPVNLGELSNKAEAALIARRKEMMREFESAGLAEDDD